MDLRFAKVVRSAFRRPRSNWISLWFAWNMKGGYLLSAALYGTQKAFCESEIQSYRVCSMAVI